MYPTGRTARAPITETIGENRRVIKTAVTVDQIWQAFLDLQQEV